MVPEILHVTDLTKSYGALPALDAVSLSIRPGELLGLIGPNGAGKTTLFECLAGVLPADAGSIRAGDTVLDAHARADRLAYIPDGIAPWPAQTIRWALDFTIGYFGGRAGDRDAIVRALDLETLLDQPIGTLSKGQRKRTVLAIGLLMPQPVLLADEPFDGLDLRQSREVASVLRAHAAAGRTLFLSIHQINDAARVCDRFVLIDRGRVTAEGTVGELATMAAARGATPAGAELEEIFLALT